MHVFSGIDRYFMASCRDLKADVPFLSKLFQLLLILPATNATSERSFSALRRIKSYLRCTMSQARLNHLMILHYHQALCDTIDLKVIANEYIIKNETRKSTFAILK